MNTLRLQITAVGLALLLLLSAPIYFLGGTHVQGQEVAVETQSTVGDTTVSVTGDDVTTVDAPDATTVVIPVGNWVDALVGKSLAVVATIVAVIWAWVLRSVPASIANLLRTLMVEQIMTRAIQYGLNAVRGATAGKKLEFDVGNRVVAEAVQYFVDHAPGWLLKWVGDNKENLRKMVLARLNLDENAGKV